jgi:hypothetical protein
MQPGMEDFRMTLNGLDRLRSTFIITAVAFLADSWSKKKKEKKHKGTKLACSPSQMLFELSGRLTESSNQHIHLVFQNG